MIGSAQIKPHALCTILILCIGFYGHAQSPTYFNNIYPDDLGIVTFNVVETINGYGSIGISRKPGTSNQNLSIVEVDKKGDTIYNFIIDSSFTFYSGLEGNLAKYPGGYAMAIRSSSPVFTDMLLLLDTNFRFQTFHNITGTTRRFFNQVIYSKDYFYITGHYFTNQYPDSLHRRVPMLLKVDTTGTVVGDYNYPSYTIVPQKVINRSGHGMVPTSDGGMYIAAYYLVDYIPGVQTRDSTDFLVIKVGSNGNREWERKFGNPSLREPTFRMMAYSDTSALAFCSWALSRNLDIPEFNTSNENRIYEVYNDGRPMKLLKTYGPRGRYHAPAGAMELKNGNICFYGLNRIFKMNDSIYPGIMNSYTFILSPRLDSINYQLHQSNNLHITDYSYIFDARPTTDGGIITGGYLETENSPLNNGTAGFHIWLTKLDSLGCPVAGCQYIGLGEERLAGAKVEVYPNPATDLCYIDAGVNYPLKISVYNISGNMVKEQTIRFRNHPIDLVGLSNGVYLLKITGKEFEVFKKIILYR